MQNIYQADPKKIIVCMVGLPARGKSYISKKIYRYLNWLGFKTEVFNIGNFRRKYCAQNNIESKADFFSQEDQYYMGLRQKIANITISELIQFINKEDSKVVILDGTNSTNKRRQNLVDRLKNEMKCQYQLIWVESVCNCEQTINENIKKVKSHGLDYAQMSMEEAFVDFQNRIQHYDKYYQTLTKESGLSYVKIIDVGKGIQASNISGYLPEKIMAYVINLKISPNRIIYLSRHGESAYNSENRIGGNPNLSAKGVKYAKALPKIFTQVLPEKEKEEIVLLTSTLKRTKQTVQKLKDLKFNPVQPIQIRILDELNAGICEEMTYEQIQEKFPQVSKARSKDKLRFRYPSGESYLDVIGRLQPLIYWIQRQNHPIAIFGHQAVLRCVKAYFFNVELEKIPYIDMPLHTIIRLTPQAYTFRTQHIVVNVETQQIHSINKVSQKKYSIDRDGSNNYGK